MLAIPDDATGVWAQVIKTWNNAHPSEMVTLRELSADAVQRRSTLADSLQANSGEFTVMALDPVWIPEFASNNWITELPASSFPTTGLLAASVKSGSYDGSLYGYPISTDAGVLYYRKDLLAAAGLKAPKTWTELTTACARVIASLRSLRCYGTSLQQSEELTVNVAEAISSAGGQLVKADGTPGLDSTSASQGLRWLTDAVSDGTIPSAALGWQSDQSEQAFADGELVFLRGWSGAWSRIQATDGTSKVLGKVGMTQVPGRTGVGVATTGGSDLAISANARNQGTAGELIRWLASDQVQREFLAKGSVAPVIESLYSDAALVKQEPYLPTLGAAITAAQPRPSTVKYAELSAAVQQAIYPVLQGKTELSTALPDLQSKLTDLLK